MMDSEAGLYFGTPALRLRLFMPLFYAEVSGSMYSPSITSGLVFAAIACYLRHTIPLEYTVLREMSTIFRNEKSPNKSLFFPIIIILLFIIYLFIYNNVD